MCYKSLNIYNISICPLPLVMGERVLLCDEMWSGIDSEEVKVLYPFNDMLCHTVYKGGCNQRGEHDLNILIDGDDLNILSSDIYRRISKNHLFVKLWAAFEKDLDLIPYGAAEQINLDQTCLAIMGWEVINSAGCSVSYEGIYPLISYSDYFHLKRERDNIFPINKWGLFDSLESAEKYCDRNNKSNPDNGPWFPVAILTDHFSKARLEEFYDSHCKRIK